MAEQGSSENSVQTLEQGHIYFFYRPRVEQEEPQGAEDIQRLMMVIHPFDTADYRLLQIGRRQLSDPAEGGKGQIWGFVDSVTDRPEKTEEALRGATYQTKTRGERHKPSARPAGEGIYRILRHDDHTHLVYALELPRRPKDVQKELNIAEDASYVISIKNPEAGSPRAAGLSEDQQAKYPKRLQKVFRDRRFCECDPPDFLNRKGTEFLLVAASEDVSEDLGIRLDTERESRSSADMFKDLKLDKSQHPLDPLFKGEWD